VFIATCLLVCVLAALWFVVRLSDALIRFALRRRGGPSLLVQLWALVLLPGAVLRLLMRLLIARVLRVHVTQASLHLPRELNAHGRLDIDTLEIEPTDALRESIIEMIPAIIATLGTFAAAVAAGYRLQPASDLAFVTDLPHLVRAAFTSPAQVAMGTYLMIVLSTTMALPGPLGRRSWLVSFLAPALLWLSLVALDAWPLRLLPFEEGLIRLVRSATQALGLAALWDVLILVLVQVCVWARRRHVQHRAIVQVPTATLIPQTFPNGDIVPLSEPPRPPSAFRRAR